MNREEFEMKITERGLNPKMQSISEEEYFIIERVYNFHPAISETNGKNEIADLFVKFGMSIIRDMLPRAEVMEKLGQNFRRAQAEVVRLKERMQEIREGGEI